MKIIKILIGLLVIANIAMAANNVEVHINYPSDTVFIGSYNKLEVWIQNDVVVWGFALSFEVSGTLGTIEWMQDYGDHPPYFLEGGFRGYLTAFMSNLYGLDDTMLPDSITNGGIYLPGVGVPLPTGSMRPCYSYYFYVPDGEDPGQLCIDNIYVPAGGEWLFAPESGEPVVPSYDGCPESDPANPTCPAVCFPVGTTTRPCGDANGDGNVNVGDMVYVINYVMMAMPPDEISYAFDDVNCDGRVNLADSEFIMEYLFIGGPAPCQYCP